MKNDSRIAWHYTSGERAAEILRAGVLKAAEGELGSTQPALLWFSLRQHWDPIAHGSTPSDGAWRFGVAAEELLPWRQLAAAMDRDAARALERAGRKAGSDPALWLGSRDPVELDLCRIEHLHGDHWCSADHGH